MRLRLVQLPVTVRTGAATYPAYRVAAAVQELVRRQFLDAKAAAAGDDEGVAQFVQAPPPTVVAFTPAPTYTLGRRQSLARLGADERARLAAPLTLRVRQGDFLQTFAPVVEEAPRGGLTTYHGPGQAVLWPVVDLKAPQFRNFGTTQALTVRCYSRLLETTTADVLKRRFGLDAYTTSEPGLWLQSPLPADPEHTQTQTQTQTEERKIAALGVHLRRNISALGIAVNLDIPSTRAPAPNNVPDATNPWARFVPCGIPGKGVSSVASEGRRRFGGHVPLAWDLSASAFAAKWAAAFAQHLGLEDTGVDVADAATVAQMVAHAEELLQLEAGA